MRKVIVGSLVLWLTGSCFGQTICPRHIETPIYPPIALIARVQGTVTLAATIDADGKVTNAEAIEPLGHPKLQQSAIESMLHWTFEKPPSSPFRQVIVYEYKFDNSIGPYLRETPMIKVDFDLPDHVTIRSGEFFSNPDRGRKKKR